VIFDDFVESLDQCDQIGGNFDSWANLGYFLHNKFSNTNKQFQRWFVGDIKSGLMQCFGLSKYDLAFGFFGHFIKKLGEIFSKSGHTALIFFKRLNFRAR